MSEGVPAEAGAAAAATTGKSVLAGGAWNSLTFALPQLYTTVLSVVAARFLGPTGMGRQSLIAFIELSVVFLFSGSVHLSLVRHVGEAMGRDRPGAVRRLVAWAWRVELVLALAGAAVVLVASDLRPSLRPAWVLAAIACAGGVLHTVPSSALIGLQRWRQASVVTLSTGAAATVATVVVLAAGGGITGMFAVEAVTVSVNLIWTTVIAYRVLRVAAPRAGTVQDLRSPFLRYAAVSWVGLALTFVVWRRTEFFFLERYSTDAQIAIYSVSFSAVTALARVAEALGVVVMPAFATLFGAGDAERIRSGFGRTVRLFLFVALPVTAGMLALGPAAVRLVYGNDYRATGRVLVIMMLTFPFVPLARASESLVVGLGKLRVPLVVAAVAAVTNVSLDVVLIPNHGSTGAAIANAIAQVVATAPVLVYASRLAGGVRWEAASLVRTALVSAAGGAAAWGGVRLLHGGPAGVLVGGAAGVAVFVALARSVGILSSPDAVWLQDVAGRRLGGRVGRACRALSV